MMNPKRQESSKEAEAGKTIAQLSVETATRTSNHERRLRQANTYGLRTAIDISWIDQKSMESKKHK